MSRPVPEDPTFPEPRRAALRSALMELTRERDDVTEQPLSLGSLRDHGTPGADAGSGPSRRRGRIAAIGVVVVAAAAVLVAVVLVPGGRDDARVRPAATAPAVSTAAPSPPRSGLYVPAVDVDGTGPAVGGWTVSSCPYLDGTDPASLLGTDPGPTWSAASTPAACRIFTPRGAPLMDITTFGEDAPGAAVDTAAQLRDGAVDVQPARTHTGDPSLDPASVTLFRTDGLTGHDLGWAATITKGSTVFLVRAAAGVDASAVDRVSSQVVDVATGSGGSALTSDLRLCAHDLGTDFARAFAGRQVTCSFGGDHATEVSVQDGTCPGGADYVVFWSTAADATDHDTYFGTQGGVLMSSPQPPSAALAVIAAQVCR